MKTTKVGVIGLGSFAHAARLPILAAREDIEMTACMARTPATVARAAQRFGFKEQYTDFDDLIENCQLDAAFVVTPKQCHYEMTIRLLEKGVHVFCEKPLAMSLAHAEDSIRISQDAGKVLMVGFNRRYAPVYEMARAEFAQSPPDVCVAFKNRPGTEFRATMENTIHMVDLLRWFCGECTGVHAHSHFTDRDYEESTEAMLRFDSGATGFLLGNRTCGQWMERLELYGDGKTVIVNAPDSITVIDRDREHTVNLTPIHNGWAALEEKMGFKKEIDAFFDYLAGGERPRTLAEDVLGTHRLLNEVLRAAGLPEMEATE